MNEEQLKKFKDQIYNPYLEAWSIIASLKEMDLSLDSSWKKYMSACDAFYNKYKNGYYKPVFREYCFSLYRVMLDAGDCAKKVWDGEM